MTSIGKLLRREYVFEGLLFALVVTLAFHEYLLFGYYPSTKTDLYYQSLPFLEAFLDQAREWRHPQWNPGLFLGVPFASSGFSSVNPLYLLAHVLSKEAVLRILFFCSFWISSMSMFALLRRGFRLDRIPAQAGALFFAGFYFVLGIGTSYHLPLFFLTLGLIPLWILFLDRAVESDTPRDSLLAGAIAGLSVLTGQTLLLPVVFFVSFTFVAGITLGAVGSKGICRMWAGAKHYALFLAMTLACSAYQILPFAVQTLGSQRNLDLSDYRNNAYLALTKPLFLKLVGMALPNFRSLSPIALLAFFFLGAFLRSFRKGDGRLDGQFRDKFLRWALAAGAAVAVLEFTPLNHALKLNVSWIYSSAVSLQLLLAICLAMGCQAMERPGRLFRGALALAATAYLCWTAALLFPDALREALKSFVAWLASRNADWATLVEGKMFALPEEPPWAWTSGVVFAAALSLVLLAFAVRKTGREAMLAAVFAISVVGMIRINAIPVAGRESDYRKLTSTPEGEYLQKNAGRLWRIAAVTKGRYVNSLRTALPLLNDLVLSEGLSNLAGYQSVYPMRTKRFLSLLEETAEENYRSNNYNQPRIGRVESPLMDVAGVKYLLSDQPLVSSKWTPVFAGDFLTVYENDSALPRVSWTASVRTARNGDEALVSLGQNSVYEGPYAEGLAEGAVATPLPGQDAASAALSWSIPSEDAFEIQIEAKSAGWLRIADSFDAGWKASIDGVPSPLYRTDYVFMGLPIPEGRHIVSLRYRPWETLAGAVLSLSGIALTGALLFSRYKGRLRETGVRHAPAPVLADGAAPVTLSYVIPAYDEEPIIGQALERIDADLSGLAGKISDYEIIVVDDGSRDRTAEIVAGFQAGHPKVRLVRHERNGGVGQAIRTGIREASFEWVSVNCADEPFRTADIRHVAPLFRHNDVVVVCRTDRSANSWYRKLTSWGNYLLIRLLFGSSVRDFQFTQFYRRSYLSRIDLVSNGSLLPPEMIFKCQRLGARIAQIALPFHPRRGGESKYGHPKHVFVTLWEMARLRWNFWKENRAV